MEILEIKKKNSLTYNSGFEILYKDKKGAMKSWELVSRGNIDTVRSQILEGKVVSAAAAIVATDKKRERLCVIRQFRVPAGKYIYELPAGLMDEGEKVQEAAIREFHEETGMDLKVEKVSPPRYTSIGLTDERISLVYGTYSGEVSKDFLEDSEDITVELADRKRLKEILEKEEVTNRASLIIENFLLS